MASCKDCIHYDVCEALESGNGIKKVHPVQCGVFKNKADVVEVVRCKDCNHKVDFKGRVMCNRNAKKIGEEWCGLTATDNEHFCSYGERSETNAE